MSLDVYIKKRDFKSTPEPIDAKPRRRKSLSFVVQRHHARRLHYDFRLEMNGVLKSWAIPKGPSMVPGEKRLAILVEDHPLPYGKFYGEIPEGNYGAGSVEIWDKGTYKPSIENGDPQSTLIGMLDKGDIKLTLKGTYLKGKFALFHLKNQEVDNQWMLVKKDDEYAAKNFNIEELKPVKTKKDSGAKTRESNPPEPFPEPMPKPMLAKLSKEIMDNPSWIYEMKFDGYRMLSSVVNGTVKMVSRNGNSFNKTYPLLKEDLEIIEDTVILDGEMVIENSKGMSDFQMLQNYKTTQKGNLKYNVFDILYLNGHNIMGFPLLKRKELLEAFFNKYQFEHIIHVNYQIGGGKKLFEELSAKGFEGIIAKDPQGTYMAGKRGESWLKIKSVNMQEFIICGFTLPQGSRHYFGSLILGIYNEGELQYVGNCGTGFNEISLKELYGKFELLKMEKCPFPVKPKLSWTKGKPIWLKPKLVANIKFLEWSKDGIMRAPVFLGLRDDKDANEVVNEMKENGVAQSVNEMKRIKNTENEKIIVLSGKKVKCTNLQKIYWPGEGYTKGDLIDYYQSVSKFILPYLKDRPQSLNRHPNGIGGKSFYHKDMDTEQLPEWLRTKNIYSKSNDKGIDYLICNDAATLVYMANLGCIEINPWHSTWQKPGHPSYMMLDLDPGNISFIDVVNTALVIKELCDDIDIPCYCKTSGATGLHIYIPLGSLYDYEQAKTFAEILADITHKRLPSTTSIERPVAKRKDKVYIDFLQNRSGQTIAAPYSVRPRPFATVSTPLEWDEVNHKLSPELFTIKNIGKRLEKKGDLWKPVLGKGISLGKALDAIKNLS